MEMTKKEEKKSEWEKELVYNTVYLPVRFFKKEAYIRIDDYKEVRDKREKVVEGLEEENKNLKLENADLMGERDGLKMVVERLHKEIEEQEAEGGGLFDEIDYRKREAKRLGWKPNN